MGVRGRTGIAELTVIGPGGIETVKRPDPPGELTDEQATEWRAIVNRLGASWFPRETASRRSAHENGSAASLSTCSRTLRHSLVSGDGAMWSEVEYATSRTGVVWPIEGAHTRARKVGGTVTELPSAQPIQ
jgi:hypothetical protein